MRILLSVISLLLPMALAASEVGPPLSDYSATKIARNSYVIHGPLGVPSVENQGFMNNPAFITTATGVVIIDPGSSLQSGEMVLRQIEGVTKMPVVAVINTHMHGDHWLGNHAIYNRYPEVAIYGHPDMRARVEAGVGEEWRQLLLRLTDKATMGTEIVPPNHSIDHQDELTIGDTLFRFIHTGVAHTPNDLMLEIPEEGVIFLGDNVLYKRLGQMDDGTILGNIAAIERALESRQAIFVPGHGPTGGREIALAYHRYLSRLYQSVERYYDDNLTPAEMKEDVIIEMSEFHDWVGFQQVIGRHINLVYLEVEEAKF